VDGFVASFLISSCADVSTCFYMHVGDNTQSSYVQFNDVIECTRLTHSYLIQHTDPPKCTSCNHLLSVKHILTECTSCGQTRHQYYSFTDIKNIFNHTPSQNILNFI